MAYADYNLIPVITSKVRENLSMLTRVKHLVLSVTLVATVASQILASAQSTLTSSHESSGVTYHHSVSEVRLVFFATDERNHSVNDLQKNDFAVVDDEAIIRDFRSFAGLI